MSNQWDDMRAAVQQAKYTLSARDSVIKQMVELIADGDLKHADAGDLKKLKKQLRKFNIHTGRWSK